MSKTSKHPNTLIPASSPLDERETKGLGKRARTALVAGALIVGGLVGISSVTNQSPEGILQAQAEGTEEAQVNERLLESRIKEGEAIVENSVIVLGSGVSFRTEPSRRDNLNNPEDNKLYTIAEGESVVLDRPVVIEDGDGERWALAHLKVGQINTPEGVVPNTSMGWVNLSALKTESEQGSKSNLYNEIAYSGTEISRLGSDYQVELSDQVITGLINPNTGTELSTAVVYPTQDANRQAELLTQ